MHDMSGRALPATLFRHLHRMGGVRGGWMPLSVSISLPLSVRIRRGTERGKVKMQTNVHKRKSANVWTNEKENKNEKREHFRLAISYQSVPHNGITITSWTVHNSAQILRKRHSPSVPLWPTLHTHIADTVASTHRGEIQNNNDNNNKMVNAVNETYVVLVRFDSATAVTQFLLLESRFSYTYCVYTRQ